MHATAITITIATIVVLLLSLLLLIYVERGPAVIQGFMRLAAVK